MKAVAESLVALMDVLQRALLWLALVLVLVAPQWFPLLDRFVFETTEINILGQTLKVSDTRRLPGAGVPGLEIADGKVRLNGEDISLLPGERDRLRAEVAALRADNQAMARQLDEAAHQAAELARAQSAAGSAPAQQRQALEQLAQTTRAAAQTAAPAAAPPAAPPAPPAAASMVLLASDTTAGRGGALDEVVKARAWVAKNAPGASVVVFLRNGFYATAVVFPARDAALGALQALRQAFRTDAYVADLRSWCPAAVTATPRREGGLDVIDCRF